VQFIGKKGKEKSLAGIGTAGSPLMLGGHVPRSAGGCGKRICKGTR